MGIEQDIRNLESSILSECVSIQDLVKARFLLVYCEEGNEGEYDKIKDIYKKSVAIYEKVSGKLIKQYYCNESKTGAVLTSSSLVEVYTGEYELEDPELLILMNRASELGSKIMNQLEGRIQLRMSRRIYSIFTFILDEQNGLISAILDSDGSEESSAQNRLKSNLKSIEKMVDAVEVEFQEVLNSKIRIVYTLGAFLAIPIGSIVMLPTFYFLNRNLEWNASQPVLAAILFGVMGSVASIIIRSDNEIKAFHPLFKTASSGKVLLSFGLLRSFIGALFGTMVFVFVESGLVPLSTGESQVERVLMFSALSFLAGFGERFIHDAIGVPK